MISLSPIGFSILLLEDWQSILNRYYSTYTCTQIINLALLSVRTDVFVYGVLDYSRMVNGCNQLELSQYITSKLKFRVLLMV